MQWTGNDSKALMKVSLSNSPFVCQYSQQQIYLPAIKGHVPSDMVQAICDFLEFCYVAQCNIIYEKSLHDLRHALSHFHQYHEIF